MATVDTPAGGFVTIAVSSVTLTGSPGEITTTLKNTTGLVYTPLPLFNGDDNLHVEVNDNGNTGAGGPFQKDVPKEQILIQKVSVVEEAATPE